MDQIDWKRVGLRLESLASTGTHPLSYSYWKCRCFSRRESPAQVASKPPQPTIRRPINCEVPHHTTICKLSRKAIYYPCPRAPCEPAKLSPYGTKSLSEIPIRLYPSLSKPSGLRFRTSNLAMRSSMPVPSPGPTPTANITLSMNASLEANPPV